MTLKLGEVVLVESPFHQRLGSKIRPVITMLDVGDDDFLSVPITSVSRDHALDLPILELKAAGLQLVSFARVHKIGVLHKLAVRRRLGQLSSVDLESVKGTLCGALCHHAAG